MRGEIVGADLRQPAAVAAERRAHRIENVRGAHRSSSSRSAESSSAVGGSVVWSSFAHLQLPAGLLAHLVDLDARVDLGEHELLRLWVGLEHAEIGDHRGRPAAAEAEALARARAPSPWPTVVQKSSFSTNVRLACGAITITSPQLAAISGAPPAPGSRVFGWS